MKSRISKVENKLEASHQFHEEVFPIENPIGKISLKIPLKILGITNSLIFKVLAHYKSHIAKLELEIEDLKRKEARNDVMVSSPHNQSKLYGE